MLNPLRFSPLAPIFCSVLALGGCTAPPAAPKGLAPEPERIVRAGLYRPAVVGNRGRLVGTLTLDRRALAAAGVQGPAGATAEVQEAAGAVLAGPVPVDAAGHFLLEGLKPSRSWIFVVVRFRGEKTPLRLTAMVAAPRKFEDRPVLVNTSTTFVADRFRRGFNLREADPDNFRSETLALLEDVTLSYMDEDRRLGVVTELDGDFNAFAFDHLVEDRPGLKRLLYQMAPGLLRGWKPQALPPRTPLVTPSPSPPARPQGNTDGPPVIPS